MADVPPIRVIAVVGHPVVIPVLVDDDLYEFPNRLCLILFNCSIEEISISPSPSLSISPGAAEVRFRIDREMIMVVNNEDLMKLNFV